jgi:hypothetical protein
LSIGQQTSIDKVLEFTSLENGQIGSKIGRSCPALHSLRMPKSNHQCTPQWSKTLVSARLWRRYTLDALKQLAIITLSFNANQSLPQFGVGLPSSDSY